MRYVAATNASEAFGILDTDWAVASSAVASFGADRVRRDMFLARANDPNDEYDARANLYWSNSEGWSPEPVAEPSVERSTPTEEVATFRGLSETAATAKLRTLIVQRNEAERMLTIEREARRQERERLSARVERLSAPITDTSDERLLPIWEQAEQAAADNGFCAEYDRLCNSLGIPGRERQWRGVVTVRFNAYVYADARGEDDAREAMEMKLSERVSELDGVEGVSSVDIEVVESEDVQIY